MTGNISAGARFAEGFARFGIGALAAVPAGFLVAAWVVARANPAPWLDDVVLMGVVLGGGVLMTLVSSLRAAGALACFVNASGFALLPPLLVLVIGQAVAGAVRAANAGASGAETLGGLLGAGLIGAAGTGAGVLAILAGLSVSLFLYALAALIWFVRPAAPVGAGHAVDLAPADLPPRIEPRLR
jgi:hypothetical protein